MSTPTKEQVEAAKRIAANKFLEGDFALLNGAHPMDVLYDALTAQEQENAALKVHHDETLRHVQWFKDTITDLEQKLARAEVLIHKAHVALKGALDYLDMVEAPMRQPGHICGPDAGCDGECMAAAHYYDMTRPFRDTLRELKRVDDQIRAAATPTNEESKT